MRHRIESRSNPRVKDLVKNRDCYLFLEGEKLVMDILQEKMNVKILIVHKEKEEELGIPGKNVKETWIVNDTVLKKLSSLKEKPAFIAVLEPGKKIVDFRKTKIVVGLDEVQDPANAGTVFRCAAAFGIDAVVFSGPSVKPTNTKFLRAAQDAFFHVPFQHFDSLESLLEKAGKANVNVYLTSSHESPNTQKIEALRFPCLILLGNEGKGLPEELFLRYPTLKITQTNKVESLNVGISACIIMHELTKRPQGALL